MKDESPTTTTINEAEIVRTVAHLRGIALDEWLLAYRNRVKRIPFVRILLKRALQRQAEEEAAEHI